MKIYTVHVNPSNANARQKPVFVREGFNIPAFLLTVFWLLYQRLWLHALCVVTANAVLITLGTEHIISSNSVGIMQLGVQALVGFHANDWLRARLTRQGYITADISVSDNLLRAQQRYFERSLAPA